jgi:hypothetical protein
LADKAAAPNSYGGYQMSKESPTLLRSGVRPIDTLRDCFSRFQPFKFSLKTINQFPGETLYLVPEPEDPFRETTRSEN